jgi:hypothetical protein
MPTVDDLFEFKSSVEGTHDRGQKEVYDGGLGNFGPAIRKPRNGRNFSKVETQRQCPKR